MTADGTQEHKRVGWRELLTGVSLGGLTSWLTTSAVRKEQVDALRQMATDAANRFEDMNPSRVASEMGRTTIDLIDSVISREPTTQWELSRKDFVAKSLGVDRIGAFGGLKRPVEGLKTAFKRTGALERIAVVGSSVAVLLGSVMLVNHFRNVRRHQGASSSSNDLSNTNEPTR